MNSLILVTLIGCQLSSNSPVDCYGLERGSEKNDCWSKQIMEVFSQDSEKALQIIQEEISDQQVKDFLLLEITKNADAPLIEYCQQIQGKALQDRCRILISRPHLKRNGTHNNVSKP